MCLVCSTSLIQAQVTVVGFEFNVSESTLSIKVSLNKTHIKVIMLCLIHKNVAIGDLQEPKVVFTQ